MKILIDIGHPGHVHFFKNTIWELEKNGHEVLVTARGKEVTVDLLKAYGIKHKVLTSMKKGKMNLFLEWIIRDYKLLKIAKEFNPDVLTGILNPSVAHVAWLLNKKSIIFNDTEHAKLAQNITYPFSDIICTPTCFKTEIGVKQVKYSGYHELSYLGPNYFTPTPDVLKELGLTVNDTFIILRFVSWGASHDGGQKGIDDKVKLVEKLAEYGRVFITSEAKLDDNLEKYRLKISPEKLHDLLYYATLYVGEGATTASECAVLGTHAIYVNTLSLGYTDEEEIKYQLVYNFCNKENMEIKAFDKAIELLQNKELRSEGKQKRKKLLRDKIDVTNFMVASIEAYSIDNHFYSSEKYRSEKYPEEYSTPMESL